MVLFAAVLFEPQIQAQTGPSLQQTVTERVTNERSAAQQKPPFLYTSIERSERTNGHLWTERVAEISQGKLRYLISEDGYPLSAERDNAELTRLKTIATHPDDFIRHEQARNNDEQHAQQMLALLPSAFLFMRSGNEGPWLRINYQPNPAYTPRNYEERVLHGMSGIMLVDGQSLRLHRLEGHLNGDVTFAYGLLATIHGGSSFATTRDPVAPGIWKTTSIDAHVDARAIFFKTISRQQRSEHRGFVPLPANLSIQQAVALLSR